MDTFKVIIDRTAKSISVMNNGKGIPIEMHSKEKMWIPEMIFGHLFVAVLECLSPLTGSALIKTVCS